MKERLNRIRRSLTGSVGSNDNMSNSSIHSNEVAPVEPPPIVIQTAEPSRFPRFARRGSLDFKLGNKSNNDSINEMSNSESNNNKSLVSTLNFMFPRRASIGQPPQQPQRRSSLGNTPPDQVQQLSGSIATASIVTAEPIRLNRIFRRASLGNDPGSAPWYATRTDDATVASAQSAPERAPRRGSFGPRGDANPPRLVSRRESIGQQDANNPLVDNISGHTAESVPSQMVKGKLSEGGGDFHQDSIRRVVVTDANRRTSRRSSVGPGIQVPAPPLPPPPPLEPAADASSFSKQAPRRKKRNFVNPFRRRSSFTPSDDYNEPHEFADATSIQESLTSYGQAQMDYLPHTPDQSNLRKSINRASLLPDGSGEESEFGTVSPSPEYGMTARETTVRFAAEPRVHVFDYAEHVLGGSPEEDAVNLANLKALLWWNSEEMASIRQECMEVVKDYLDDTEYMDAITKLFSAHKKSVTPDDVRKAMQHVSQHSEIRGLEMHVCPRGGLLCEKHRRIVLTNVACATVDGLSNTGEGWLLIRKESMKASRACRQYALKMAEHDAMEAIESVMSNWEDEESSNGQNDIEEDSEEPSDNQEESQFDESGAVHEIVSEDVTDGTAKKKRNANSNDKKKKPSGRKMKKISLFSGGNSKNDKKDVAPLVPLKKTSIVEVSDELSGLAQASGEASSQ